MELLWDQEGYWFIENWQASIAERRDRNHQFNLTGESWYVRARGYTKDIKGLCGIVEASELITIQNYCTVIKGTSRVAGAHWKGRVTRAH